MPQNKYSLLVRLTIFNLSCKRTIFYKNYAIENPLQNFYI